MVIFHEWQGDPEIKAALDWFLSFFEPFEWELKKKNIDDYLKDILRAKTEPTPLTFESPKILYPKDRFAWYLYLADSYNNHIEDYEFSQGARVIPIFKIIGKHLELVKSLRGVKSVVHRMIVDQKNDPDGALFELLVGLLYMRNGWEYVDFLHVSSASKTPDIHVRSKNSEWYVECKRLSKSSEYSEKERDCWLKISQPLRDYLTFKREPLIIDIVFHVELDSLDSSIVEEKLIPKIKLAGSKGILVEDNIWTVSIDFVDFPRIAKHMAEYSVKVPSSTLIDLVFNHCESGRGYSPIIKAKMSPTKKGYVDSIDFAAGIVWNCDAEEAINKKSRHIMRHLSEATSQLPFGTPGIIHIGIESHDGAIVEDERFKKIVLKTMNFDSRNKSLDWIYCHIFDPKVPPDDNWDFGETIIHFSSDRALEEPLEHRAAVLPHDAETWDGVCFGEGKRGMARICQSQRGLSLTLLKSISVSGNTK